MFQVCFLLLILLIPYGRNVCVVQYHHNTSVIVTNFANFTYDQWETEWTSCQEPSLGIKFWTTATYQFFTYNDTGTGRNGTDHIPWELVAGQFGPFVLAFPMLLTAAIFLQITWNKRRWKKAVRETPISDQII